MKNILITGGAGNIGGSLVRALVENGSYFIQIVDNLSTGKMDNLPDQNIGNWDFIQCDVNNNSEISSVMRRVKFDVVFHYAAMVGVERTQLNPNLSKETNVKRVFYASSSEVYGEAVSTYQHEITTPLNSRLPYAIVKNVGESFFRSFGEEHGLKYTIFRFFNTYGPLQNNDFVVSRFINKALNNEDIYIYGDGSQSRTFLHVNDNISFTLKVLSNGALINDIVNVGNDKEVTVKELANIIKDMLNSKSKINYIDPLKEGDMQRRRPDIMKMIEFYKKDLISIEDGISLIMQEWNS